MKYFKGLSILFCFCLSLLEGQEIINGNLNPYSRNRLVNVSFDQKEKKDTLHSWKIQLNNTLLFNQLMVENWTAGGVNSYSGTARIDYDFYYSKKRHRWDNRIIAAYGLKSEENDVHGARKTEDVIDLTTSYRYQLKNNWYLGSSVNAKSQFSKGYEFDDTEKTKISNFLAPGYVTVGAGLDYVLKDKLELSLHPLSSRTTIVLDEELRSRFNVDENKTYQTSIGMFLGGRHRFKIVENVKLDQTFGIYSEYSNKPLNLDLAYRVLIDMKINNFMSTKITFETLYDEDQIEKVQIKETLGVGFTYKFENHKKKKKTESS
ncbi:hypothetical protein UJ101_00790 [Flavobacteriaceae bacterium UJ101]|nr:hypothetical protein UJ101_00790 [Flavobacteriaceae bacterium UJ101]